MLRSGNEGDGDKANMISLPMNVPLHLRRVC